MELFKKKTSTVYCTNCKNRPVITYNIDLFCKSCISDKRDVENERKCSAHAECYKREFKLNETIELLTDNMQNIISECNDDIKKMRKLFDQQLIDSEILNEKIHKNNNIGDKDGPTEEDPPGPSAPSALSEIEKVKIINKLKKNQDKLKKNQDKLKLIGKNDKFDKFKRLSRGKSSVKK